MSVNRITLVGWIILIASSALLAQPLQHIPPLRVFPGSHDKSNRLCGLYCVDQAAGFHGISIDRNQLFSVGRIGDREGLTAADLDQVLLEFNIPHRSPETASLTHLMLVEGPFLALLRSAPELREPNHWIIVLNVDFSTATIYDPGAGLLKVKRSTLSLLWGGTILCLRPPTSDQDIVVVLLNTMGVLAA
jgi:ABC-type bacteriocin/lantibiotic exporter with double-glycine peptidase domain